MTLLARRNLNKAISDMKENELLATNKIPHFIAIVNLAENTLTAIRNPMGRRTKTAVEFFN